MSELTLVVKVVNANDNLLNNLWSAMDKDNSVQCKYVDIARKGFQDTRNILYVQCHQNHKATLMAWIKKYISNTPQLEGGKNAPRVDESYISPSNKKSNHSRQSDNQTANTALLTEFHYVHGDELYRAMPSEAESKGHSKRSSLERRSKGSAAFQPTWT